MAEENKVTDDELIQVIFEEISAADYEGASELKEQRAEADLAYTGEFTPGTEPNSGMSSILINAYQPAVDTLTTYISNAVNEKRKAVMFQVEDEELKSSASELTTMLNNCIYKKNKGYTVINRWIKDAFLHKTAFVKTYWDTTAEYYKFEFEGAEEQLAVVMAEKEAEGWECEVMEKQDVTETLEVTSEDSNETLEVTTTVLQAIVKCSKPMNQPRIVNVAPEEFYVNEGATSLDRNDPTLRFLCHSQLRSKSDVQELINSDERFDQDIDVDELAQGGTAGYIDQEWEKATRGSFDGTYWRGTEQSSQPLLQEVEVIEYWVRSDRDGDGVAEWRHGFVLGKELGMDEEHFGAIPVHSFTPFPIPHKLYGLGLWDKLRDYHRTKTGLVRAAIDAANNKNLVRFFADPRKVDTRSLKSGKPGIIPIFSGFDPSKDMREIPKPTGSAGESVTLLQYLDAEIVAQIGIDPKTGVVSTDIEKSGNDAAKTAQAIDNASTKIEALVRELAENGLRDMVWAIYDMYLEYGELQDIGFDKSDLIAKVGTGYQTMQQKAAGAQAIIQQHAAMEASPTSPTPIPYKYKKEINMELASALGFEDASKFFPSAEEIQQAQQRQAQQQAMQMQAMQQAQSQEMGLKEREIGVKEQTQAAKIEAETNKLNKEAEVAVVEIQNKQSDNELNIRRQEAQEEQMAANIELQQANQELQRELAELKASTELEKQRMADEKTININSGK